SEVDGGKRRKRQPGILADRLLHFQLYVTKHHHRLDPRLDDLFGKGAGVDAAAMTRVRGGFGRGRSRRRSLLLRRSRLARNPSAPKPWFLPESNAIPRGKHRRSRNAWHQGSALSAD